MENEQVHDAPSQGHTNKRIMWTKIRSTCPVCKKACKNRSGTLRHMRWAHALALPTSVAPLKSPQEYAKQLRAMHTGVRTKKKQQRAQDGWKQSIPMGSDVRWMTDEPDKKMVNGATVRHCPNCGFELDRVTIRR